MRLTKNDDNDKKLSEEIKRVGDAHDQWHATAKVLKQNHDKLWGLLDTKKTPEEKHSLHDAFRHSTYAIESHHNSYANLPELSDWAKQEIIDRHNNWHSTREKLEKEVGEKEAFKNFFQMGINENNYGSNRILDNTPPFMAHKEAVERLNAHLGSHKSLPKLHKDYSLTHEKDPDKATYKAIFSGVKRREPEELDHNYTVIPSTVSMPPTKQTDPAGEKTRIRPRTPEEMKTQKNRQDARDTRESHQAGDSGNIEKLNRNKEAIDRYSRAEAAIADINAKLNDSKLSREERRNILFTELPPLQEEFNKYKGHPAVKQYLIDSAQDRLRRFGGRNLGKSNTHGKDPAHMFFKDRKHFEESLIKSVKSDIKRFILKNGLNKSDMSSKINQHADWHRKLNSIKYALSNASRDSAQNSQNPSHPSHSEKQRLRQEMRDHLATQKDLPHVPGIEKASFQFNKPGERALSPEQTAELEQRIKQQGAGAKETRDIGYDPELERLNQAPKKMSSRESARQDDSSRVSEESDSGFGLPLDMSNEETDTFLKKPRPVRWTVDPGEHTEYKRPIPDRDIEFEYDDEDEDENK